MSRAALTRRRRYFLAKVYANYEEAVRTISLVSEHGDLDRAEAERRRRDRAEVHGFDLLIVTAGRSWPEAERELEARLGD